MKDLSLILGYFPGLKTDKAFQVTSEKTRDYNCIAWASGVNNRWEWPPLDNTTPEDDEYWPAGAMNSERLEAFIQNFESKGFEHCDNEAIEPEVQKIALFAKEGNCTHASLQLPDGTWTSKLGFLNDISHSLHALEGELYGSVACIMRRPISRK